MERLRNRFYAKSVTFVGQLQANMRTVVLIWVALASALCGFRLGAPITAIEPGMASLASMLPYFLVVAAPVVSLFLALHWFPRGALLAQPQIRLARFGNWRTLDCLTQRNLPLFGATGLMASLLLGMLLNIPIRTVEFLTAMPAPGGSAPGWLASLYTLMLADVVVVTSLYAVAFVMALRHVPWFPRFLALVWAFDLLAQSSIAKLMANVPDVPLAVSGALEGLLTGNSKKALISIAIWLPYLLFSRRVNLTYRSRVPD